MKETLPSGEICSSLHTYMTWSDQMPWIINRYHRNKRLENSTWLDGKLLNWTQFLAQILNVNIHCKNQTKCHTSCHRVFCCSPYTCIHSPLISTESRLSCSIYFFGSSCLSSKLRRVILTSQDWTNKQFSLCFFELEE